MLKALAFLSILEDRDLEWLVANSRRKDIPAGSALIRLDEPAEFLYLIVDGVFNVTVAVPEERHVARIYAGELLGEMSFVDSHPPSATVTAGVNSSVLAISREDLVDKMQQDLEFSGRFYKGIALLLSDRLRTASRGHEKPRARTSAEDKEEMEILAARFAEIQRHLELERRSKGA